MQGPLGQSSAAVRCVGGPNTVLGGSIGISYVAFSPVLGSNLALLGFWV